ICFLCVFCVVGKVIALDTSIVVTSFAQLCPSSTRLFYRTLTFLEHDIKPVFVFDGKPPNQKKAVLEKRAQSAGWNSSYRSNTVSTKTQEFLRLVQLMGMPFIMAPADGEALCAHLVRGGVVDAVASEDMDTLAFGGTTLLRHTTINTFVDLCILLGCDYCDKITGLGPSRALKLIQQHRTIEHVKQNVNKKTHPVPLAWQYQAARRLFLEAPQVDTPDLAWSDPDEEGLVKFLCVEKNIKEEKVRGRMEKYRQTLSKRRKEREEAKKEGRTRQSRMEEFFRVTRKRPSADTALSSSSSGSGSKSVKKAKRK
uniref:Zgc:110269 n=1 Tax=Astyanax mexicanus TaxID=7994 RepID=A0A3B1JCR4_ASTMX